MTTPHKFDISFYCFSAAAGVALLLSGCEALTGSGLLDPGPDGRTPLATGIEAIPKVVGNPLDLEAWGQIAGVVVIGVASLFGYRKIRKSATTAERVRVAEETRVTDVATTDERARVKAEADVVAAAVLAALAKKEQGV